MRKNLILEIYALVICAICTVTCAIAIGIGLYGIVRIQAPDFTLWQHVYRQYLNNELFQASLSETTRERVADYSEEKVSSLREEMYQTQLLAEQRDGMQSLIRVCITLLVMLSLFALHWQIARRVRE